MHLSAQQAKRFNRLYDQLIYFTAKETDIEASQINLKTLKGLSPDGEETAIVRLWEGSEMLDRFIEENPYDLKPHDLEEIDQWRYGLVGVFAVMEHTAKGSVFMSEGQAYQVVGVSQDIQKVITQSGLKTEAEIIPFEGLIVDATRSFYIEPINDPETAAEQYQEILMEKGLLTTADDLIKSAKEWDDPIIAQIDNFFNKLMFGSDEDEDDWMSRLPLDD